MNNPAIAAQTIPSREQQNLDAPSPGVEQIIGYIKPKKDLANEPRTRNATQCLANDVAQTDFYQRNFRYPGAGEDFPVEPWYRTVAKYYPNTEFGPLFVDEPTTDLDVEKCIKRKAPKLHARGLLYVILDKSMSLEDAIQEVRKVKYDLDNRHNGSQDSAIGRTDGQTSVAENSPRKPKRVEQTIQNVRKSKNH